jgi:AcrR family transcriptional regulator
MPYVESSVRRRQIVAAARTAMETRGVAATSMRDVAATAGVPLGTLQHVFPAKAELLRAVFDDVVEEIASLHDALGAATDDDLGHQVRRGLDAFWTHLVVGRSAAQVMQLDLLASVVRDPEAGDAAGLYQRYLTVATGWCTRVVDRSGQPSAIPVEQFGRLLVAGLDGLLLQYLADGDDDRARRDLEVLAAMLDHAVTGGSTER